jgi:uncharacterized membrane protein YdjX (TVP38/TMEM64 family)
MTEESESRKKNSRKKNEKKHLLSSSNQVLKKILAILKFAILIGIIVGIPLYIYFFQHEWIDQLSSIENIKALFRRYQTQSILIYLAAQVIQIIICVIPGQWMQITAGLAFGFWGGYLWSITGAALGAVVTYYLARWLGRDAMHLFFGEEKVERYIKAFNSKRSMIIVFLLFLIPGFPKDILCYLAGLSEMKLKPFLVFSLIGRTPGMMGSILIGMQVGAHRWNVVILISVIAVILFVLCMIFRKRLMQWFNDFYDKVSG